MGLSETLRRRAPWLILGCGAFIAILTMGPRSSMGFFVGPLLTDRGFGLETFSFAIAVQNLLWGLGQPFAGALADKFGMVRVFVVGLLFYFVGLMGMAYATDPTTFTLSAGVLFGMALAGASFNLVIAAFGKLLPDSYRPLALGIGTASSSFGQFLFAPVTVILIRETGWQNTLMVFAVLMLVAIPAAFALTTPRPSKSAPAAPLPQQTLKDALREAFSHRSYILLVSGFFVCGFHIAFVTVHLPPYLADQGVAPIVAGWAIAMIGLFNIVGALSAGLLGGKFSRRWMLTGIYAARAVVFLVFILVPISTVTVLVFAAALGLLWLSTVPLTSGLVALMFGTRWLATLYGIVFLSHQIGAFVGLLIAGYGRVAYGNYDVVWWLSVALAVFAALIHMPIVEKAVVRAEEPAPAKA